MRLLLLDGTATMSDSLVGSSSTEQAKYLLGYSSLGIERTIPAMAVAAEGIHSDKTVATQVLGSSRPALAVLVLVEAGRAARRM